MLVLQTYRLHGHIIEISKTPRGYYYSVHYRDRLLQEGTAGTNEQAKLFATKVVVCT